MGGTFALSRMHMPTPSVPSNLHYTRSQQSRQLLWLPEKRQLRSSGVMVVMVGRVAQKERIFRNLQYIYIYIYIYMYIPGRKIENLS